MKLDWSDILLSDLDWSYAVEVVLRTLIMFILVIAFLRLSGKKGIRQLSLFEVAIIISLGSASGDAMFIKDNAIAPSLIVIVTILIFYRIITWLTSKSEKIESLFEGDPLYIIEDGEFVLANNRKAMFAKDEFFAEMRQQNIEHVGQVKTAILETNGTISFFYYPDQQVKYGLPVLPKPYSEKVYQILDTQPYACTFCGHVFQSEKQAQKTGASASEQVQSCNRCQQSEWVLAIDSKRLT